MVIKRRHLIGVGLPLMVGAAPRLSPISHDKEMWTFDNLQTVGEYNLALVGTPRLTASPWGPAIAFDGVGDGLIVDHHPLAGAHMFTIEALFRPDGGAFEQRWLHLESAETPPVAPGLGRSRLMFEIRVVGESWYLDAFASGPGAHLALVSPDRLFPVGRWYHVAQTYDGDTYRSFVDGTLQAMAQLPFSPPGSGSTAIGMRMNRVNYFHGAIRAARFTRQALPPSQFLFA